MEEGSDSGLNNDQPERAGAETPGPPSEQPPRRRAGGVWLWVGLLLLAAAVVVGLVIGTTLGGRQGGPLGNQPGGSGRPTIVVGTVGASPSAVAGVPSPSPSSVAGATASVGSTEYVVKPGDTLQGIAEQQYGDAGQWPKIYDANRDVIGPNPDNLVAGTTLQIPPP